MTIFESKLVVAGGLQGDVRLFNIGSGACVHVIDAIDSVPLPHINKVAVHGSTLAVCGNPWIRVYPLDKLDAPPTVYDGHAKNVTSASFHQDGKWFVSTGQDGRVRLWDLRASGYQVGIVHSSGINCGTLHPNQGVFLYGDQDGVLNHWDLAMNRVVKRTVGDGVGLGVSSVVVDSQVRSVCCHDNRIVSVLEDVDTERVDGGGGCETATQDDSSPRHAIAPAPMSRLVSRSVSSTRTVQSAKQESEYEIVNIQERAEPVQTIGCDIPAGAYVTSLSISESQSVAITSSDGGVFVWRTNDEDDSWGLDSVLYHSSEIGAEHQWCWDSAFVDSQDRFVIGAYSDGMCKLWDTSRQASQPIASYDCGASKSVRSVAVIDCGNLDVAYGRTR